MIGGNQLVMEFERLSLSKKHFNIFNNSFNLYVPTLMHRRPRTESNQQTGRDIYEMEGMN